MKSSLALFYTLALAACAEAPNTPLTASRDLASSIASSGVALVTSAADAGPGSLRAAVEVANADARVRRIEVAGVAGTVPLASPIEYTGSQPLTLHAPRLILDGAGLPAGADAFRVTGGAEMSIRGLTVRNAPANGITVQVPASATGTQRVRLVQVAILGNGGHGVEINDQAAPEEAGDADAFPPISPNSAGSAASLEVTVEHSRFGDNGFAALDRDGLRINEGGDGDLVVFIRHSTATRNGADGIELDERGPGDVRFQVSGSHVSFNGAFDTSAEPDLDDGIDVDESGPGSLVGEVSNSTANDNLEEGFDFNENDAGDFRVAMERVEASRNLEEGIDFEEDDDFAGGGDLVATLAGITTNGNAGGDAGLKIREKGVGSLEVRVAGAEASGNLTSGIQLREDAGGSLLAHVSRATTAGNDGHGIDFDENAAGDLTATVELSRSLSNGGFGVRADNAGAGAGFLRLVRVTLADNAAGDVGGASVMVTRVP